MKKILLIEDDELIARVYQCHLQLASFKVAIASDGKSGSDAVVVFKPDLVVLDLMLPKVNGIKFLQRIRMKGETISLPVIVLTNGFLPAMVEEAERLGVSQCLVKAQTDPARLDNAIREVLKLKRPPVQGPIPGKTKQLPSGVVDQKNVRPSGEKLERSDTSKDLGATESAIEQSDLNRAIFDVVEHSRQITQDLLNAQRDDEKCAVLAKLYQFVHSLSGNAALAGSELLAHLASALEALLKDLIERPRNINSSTLRTAWQAVQLFEQLKPGCTIETGSIFRNAPILAVDDDPISRTAIVSALSKAQLSCEAVERPMQACELAQRKTYELVISDLNMPEMNGFELCKKIVALPNQRNTPVIFVTLLNDFESRIKSAMMGGSDFIAKPFLSIELAVKALIFIARKRLVEAKQAKGTFTPIDGRQ